MPIDINTTIILITIGNLFTGLFVLAYIFKKQTRRNKISFLLAKLTQSCGWILFSLDQFVVATLSTAVLFGNLFMLFGLGLEAWAIIGLEERPNKTARLIYHIGIPSSIVIFTLIYLFLGTEANRLFTFSLLSWLILLPPPVLIFYKKSRSFLESVFAIGYLLVSVLLLFRAINAYGNWVDLTIFSDGIYNKIIFLLLFVHMIVTNVGFILISKEKTDVYLIEAATTDPLTKINNRQTFVDRSIECINKAREAKQPVSMIMFDLDNFKEVNDNYSHIVGDQLLIELAQCIKNVTSGCETVGRFGGDEFAILLPGHDVASSNKMAQYILDLIQQQKFSEHQLTVGISLGVTTRVPDKTTDFDTFYRMADAGLYLAKKATKSAWKRADFN